MIRQVHRFGGRWGRTVLETMQSPVANGDRVRPCAAEADAGVWQFRIQIWPARDSDFDFGFIRPNVNCEVPDPRPRTLHCKETLIERHSTSLALATLRNAGVRHFTIHNWPKHGLS